MRSRPLWWRADLCACAGYTAKRCRSSCRRLRAKLTSAEWLAANIPANGRGRQMKLLSGWPGKLSLGRSLRARPLRAALASGTPAALANWPAASGQPLARRPLVSPTAGLLALAGLAHAPAPRARMMATFWRRAARPATPAEELPMLRNSRPAEPPRSAPATLSMSFARRCGAPPDTSGPAHRDQSNDSLAQVFQSSGHYLVSSLGAACLANWPAG